MRVMRGRRLTAGLFAIAVAFVAALIARPYVHGLSFVIRAAEMQGAARRAADFDTVRVSEREVTIPTRRGPMRARLYEPAGSHRRAALLTSGLHASGIDEPRLVRLAQQLAASHIAVVTPDIPELSRFEIAPAITDAIESATRFWHAIAAGRIIVEAMSFIESASTDTRCAYIWLSTVARDSASRGLNTL